MMQPLIYTERRWLPRTVDIVLTCLAWGGFIWLIYNGLSHALQPAPGTSPFRTVLLDFLVHLILLMSGSVALIAWARYRRTLRQTTRPATGSPLSHEALALSLAMNADTISEIHKGQVHTVWHDLHGRIESIHAIAAPQIITLRISGIGALLPSRRAHRQPAPASRAALPAVVVPAESAGQRIA